MPTLLVPETQVPRTAVNRLRDIDEPIKSPFTLSRKRAFFKDDTAIPTFAYRVPSSSTFYWAKGDSVGSGGGKRRSKFLWQFNKFSRFTNRAPASLDSVDVLEPVLLLVWL